MLVKVTSDSTCDLSADIIERLNIGIIPLMSIHVHKENFIPDSFDE